MKPHPRIRKTVKWGGAVVSVLLLMALIGSGWLTAVWATGTGSTWYLTGGAARYAYGSSAPTGELPEFFLSPAYHPFIWQPGWTNIGARTVVLIDVPLYIPTAFGVSVTAFAWRLDTLARRCARTGFCPKCGYNRTGLGPGAVCPECGAAAIVPPPAAS